MAHQAIQCVTVTKPPAVFNNTCGDVTVIGNGYRGERIKAGRSNSK